MRGKHEEKPLVCEADKGFGVKKKTRGQNMRRKHEEELTNGAKATGLGFRV
jgi:hypothetical protein